MPRRREASCQLLNTPGLALTYNGRGALLQICKELSGLGKQKILMPAYHCPSGITPAIQSGLLPVFYRIKRDLNIDYEDVFRQVDANTAAILVIHYFGIPSDLRPLEKLRERGIRIIEDWSHSFLKGTPPTLSGGGSDYRIYSFWKLVPSWVGGGLWRAPDRGVPPSLSVLPLRDRVVLFKRMLENSVESGNHHLAKKFFAWMDVVRGKGHRVRVQQPMEEETVPRLGESYYPLDLSLAKSQMPGLSQRVLEACDLGEVVKKRRANFNLYGSLLMNSDQLTVIYPSVPGDACPWVFPVLLKQRDAVDYLWRASGVALHTFGIYLHSALMKNTDIATLEDAEYLSQHLLCLAIHQDLTREHIEKSSRIINSSKMT
jgi:perosamine synthetase